MADPLDLIRGTLDLLILNALGAGPKHGYAVSEWIESVSDASLLIEEGTLYPALHRLELDGTIKAKWGLSQNNRKAKYYSITGKGKKALAAQEETWNRLSAAVHRVLAR